MRLVFYDTGRDQSKVYTLLGYTRFLRHLFPLLLKGRLRRQPISKRIPLFQRSRLVERKQKCSGRCGEY